MLTGLEFPAALSNAPTISRYLGTTPISTCGLRHGCRPRFPTSRPSRRCDWPNASGQAQHHLADGGYYDNYGVAGALDWLEPVLRARLESTNGLKFRRVLLLSIASVPSRSRTPAPGPNPAAGLPYAGPVLTLMNVYSASARSRNDRELQRYVDGWNARFAAPPTTPVTCASIRSSSKGLTPSARFWHLTTKDIDKLKDIWTTNTVQTGSDEHYEDPAGLSQ